MKIESQHTQNATHYAHYQVKHHNGGKRHSI